jgi:hypothetical protein
MSKTIQYMSEKQADGTYSTPIPFGVFSENVKMENSNSLENEFQNIKGQIPVVASDDNGDNIPDGIDTNSLTDGSAWFIIEGE